jgi:ABC-type transporter Mla MlaB component
MEIKSETKINLRQPHNLKNRIPEASLIFITKQGIESTNQTYDKIKDEVKLSGVLYNGVQYYDLKNAPFINNSGLASLICLLKSLLKKGISLRFVNVNNNVKEKVKAMGLDKFINCS